VSCASRRSPSQPWSSPMRPSTSMATSPAQVRGFFADDALPVEHALVAWLVVQRAAASKVRHGGPLAVGLALVGFALFTHVDHEQLRDREGGRPMFEPALLEAASVRGGLVLVDTDHAFALGFDPRSRAQRDSVEISRDFEATRSTPSCGRRAEDPPRSRIASTSRQARRRSARTSPPPRRSWRASTCGPRSSKRALPSRPSTHRRPVRVARTRPRDLGGRQGALAAEAPGCARGAEADPRSCPSAQGTRQPSR
jgi:hypothetical protein